MNISFGDLFAEYEYNYSANYADGTTPNSVGTRAAEDFENLSCLTKKNMFLVFLVLKVECFSWSLILMLKLFLKKLTETECTFKNKKFPKGSILINASFKAKLNYCPVVWMFHNRSLNNKIKRPHERYLRNIYNERHYNFINFLNKESSFGTHSNNIDALAIELYKVANDMSHEIMSAVFKV